MESSATKSVPTNDLVRIVRAELHLLRAVEELTHMSGERNIDHIARIEAGIRYAEGLLRDERQDW